MSNDPILYGSRRKLTQQNRALSAQLEQLELGTYVDVARIERIAASQSTKVDAVMRVALTAQQDVALLSQAEQQLGQLAPAAVPRLQLIGNAATVAVAEIVHETAQKLLGR